MQMLQQASPLVWRQHLRVACAVLWLHRHILHLAVSSGLVRSLVLNSLTTPASYWAHPGAGGSQEFPVPQGHLMAGSAGSRSESRGLYACGWSQQEHRDVAPS